MAANFNVRKMRRTIERMRGCEYYIEIIIVALKDCIAQTIFFWGGINITAERITDSLRAVNGRLKVLPSKLIQYPSKNEWLPSLL